MIRKREAHRFDDAVRYAVFIAIYPVSCLPSEGKFLRAIVAWRTGLVAVISMIVLATYGNRTWADSAPAYNRPSAVFPAGDLTRGKVLAVQCLTCHGGTDVTIGEPPFHPPKLRYQRPSSIFYALQDYRDGQRRSDLMTPMAKTLSDQDMRDLSVYLSAGPNGRRGAEPGGPQMENSWAHQEVGELCGLCHGEAGLGVMNGYPALAGQYPDYLEHALLDYRSGNRTNPIMRNFARTLTPDQVRQMAAYFAAQPDLESAK